MGHNFDRFSLRRYRRPKALSGQKAHPDDGVIHDGEFDESKDDYRRPESESYPVWKSTKIQAKFDLTSIHRPAGKISYKYLGLRRVNPVGMSATMRRLPKTPVAWWEARWWTGTKTFWLQGLYQTVDHEKATSARMEYFVPSVCVFTACYYKDKLAAIQHQLLSNNKMPITTTNDHKLFDHCGNQYQSAQPSRLILPSGRALLLFQDKGCSAMVFCRFGGV